MAPLVTAGVSDDVAQALEDVQEPMPSRPATLKDPVTPGQIVLDLHRLTHFPEPPCPRTSSMSARSFLQALLLTA